MAEKVIITTDFPTPDSVAEYFGITPERRAELDRMILEIHEENLKRERRRAARKVSAHTVRRKKK